MKQVMGQPMDRVDGKLKVTGSALYAADFPVSDLVYAVAFGATIAKGRVVSIDVAEAKGMPGVVEVMTRENAAKLHRVSMEHKTGKPGQTYLPLQDDEVKYAGQYLGVVVAKTMTEALHAASVVKVKYEEGTPVVEMKGVETFEPKKMGRGEKTNFSRGDADGALAGAAVKVDEVYETPVENHNPMEMSATVAAWEGERLTLYDATQWVYGVRAVVATWLGMPDEKVRVIDPYVGGGFGCKGSIWPHVVLSAMAAKLVGRPVKLVVTRQQMFSQVGHRPRTVQRVALGAERSGKLVAVVHECTSDTSEWKDEWVETATKQSRMLYACENVKTVQKLAAVNVNTPTQMRAPGHATGTFALEVAMDELAQKVGVDPVELRLMNYAEKDGEKGLPFSSKALRECYAQAAEKFGWSKRNPAVGSMRNGVWRVGYGMATATYPTNQQEASAKVKILADGRAVVQTAGHDLGTGAYTVMTQIASEGLGIVPGRISVEMADTNLPEAPVAGGSQTTASVGSAVKMACQKAVEAIKERAGADEESPLFKKQAKEMEMGEGRVFLKGKESVGETIESLLKRNGGRPVEGKSDLPAPGGEGKEEDAGAKQNADQFSKHAWGAQFVEVWVHEKTGEIRVARVVTAIAAGRIVNAKTARSQIMGGVVWGIGAGLMEHTVYDQRNGRVVNDNLADYLVPVNADVPRVEVIFVEEKDEHVNPIGVKGIGEIGITGVAAALSNAVFHATGKRIRKLPITLDKVMA